jgi:hypothetical protein
MTASVDGDHATLCRNCGGVRGSIGCCRVSLPLHVHTARVGYRGTDGLDITAKSGKLHGLAFAPSWSILGPALDARRVAKDMRSQGREDLAKATEDEAWGIYQTEFLREMRLSYRVRRESWDWLLARESVTLLCYCSDHRCHRRILSGVILPKLGAVDYGERP